MTVLLCPLCGKLPGTKIGPPAMARCIAEDCEGRKLGAVTIAEWNTRPTPPQNCGQVEGAEAEAASYHKFWLEERDRRIAAEAKSAANADHARLADANHKLAMRTIEASKATIEALRAALRSVEPPGGEVRGPPSARVQQFINTLVPPDALLALDSNDGAGQREVGGDEKLRLFLSILQSAGGQTSGSDDPWNWINHFCDDAEPLDTFNQASKRKLTRVTHDSDSDVSWVYLTDAGKAFIASPARSVSVRSGDEWRDMNSAPKDGTEVLVWCDEGLDISRYSKEEPDGSDSMGHDAGWWGICQPMDPGRSMGNPIYTRPADNQPWAWMPKPEPPYGDDGEPLFPRASKPDSSS